MFRPGVGSIKSKSLIDFLKKVKLADIGLQYEFFHGYLTDKCFK